MTSEPWVGMAEAACRAHVQLRKPKPPKAPGIRKYRGIRWRTIRKSACFVENMTFGGLHLSDQLRLRILFTYPQDSGTW